MALIFYHNGRTPQSPQFGLDQFVEHFKCNTAADAVMIDASTPQRGDAHPDYPFMFVTDRAIQETGENASQLDVTYTGCLSGGDTPNLPPALHSKGRAIQSSTTYTSSAIFPAVATQPASLQYYAPTNVIVVFSQTDTTTDEPEDPPDITVNDLITWTLAAEQPAGSIPGIADWLLVNAFVQNITETIDVVEIVSDQFWQITKRKTKILLPYAPTS